MRLGENLVIEHNQIVDNGPIDRAAGDDLNSGIRGGIVALAASFGLDEVFDPDVREQGFDTGREAMRIHGNVVKQPAGLALAVALIGPPRSPTTGSTPSTATPVASACSSAASWCCSRAGSEPPCRPA